MMALLALVLAQPSTLNLNQQPIMSRQNGARLSTTRQYAIDCRAGMTCTVDGGVLLLESSGGGGGITAVTASSPLASSGGATPDISLTGTVPQARGGTGSGALTCGANERLTSNGTVYTCSALPAAPTAYATVEDEGVALTQRTTLEFTGAGVTCADTGAKTSCTVAGGGGGGGSLNTASASAYFDGGSLDAYTTVTAAWASGASIIVCRPTGEESSVEGAQNTVTSQGAGSFVVRTEPRNGSHWGSLPFVCLGN